MSYPAPTPVPEPVSPGIGKDEAVFIDSPVVSPRTYGEPIVTRKELWSYYRTSRSSSRFPGLQLFVIPSILQWRQRACLLFYSLLGMILKFEWVWVVSRVLAPSVSLLRHIMQDTESKDVNAPKAAP